MTITTAKPLTFEEYLTYNDGTNNRYELVEGELVLVPLPTAMHGDTVDFLLECFRTEICLQKLPWKATDKAGVYIGSDPKTGKDSSRTPDVCVMTKTQWESLKADRISSAILRSTPILVVEVVSPGSKKIDYTAKEAEYKNAKIPEYWIVDLSQSKIYVLLLSEGKYELSEFTGSQRIISKAFPKLTLTVEAVMKA